MATSASRTLDFAALKRALVDGDADTVTDCYAPDAELHILDKHRTPSAPRVIRGRDAIGEHWTDICSRDMTHMVDHEVLNDHRVSFLEWCELPDRTRVTAANVLELDGGTIARHQMIVVWDGE
jgi:hypothetical protein